MKLIHNGHCRRFLVIDPTTFYAANAMAYQLSSFKMSCGTDLELKVGLEKFTCC